ncbi:MAG: hydroxyethylthiazole kinase [Acidobacteriota bacterium]|nr:hydroxyethylthiazole kinase [Acidobacteriota bacterium]
MNLTAKDIIQDLELVRTKSPLVHNITNYVVMNSTANALLAIGASPVMAHAMDEVEDMVAIASALVINIGTLSETWVAAMGKAAAAAGRRNIPIVYDPVGVGATPYRTRVFRRLIETAWPTVIRGNASEIIASAGDFSATKGVDSAAAAESALASAQWLSGQHDCVVCVSGETDYVVDHDAIVMVRNGHPLMPRVTGLGCTATALCGAFAAVQPDPFRATVSAMAVMGIAGEIAAERSAGPGSMQVNFLDALFQLTDKEIGKRLKIS